MYIVQKLLLKMDQVQCDTLDIYKHINISHIVCSVHGMLLAESLVADCVVSSPVVPIRPVVPPNTPVVPASTPVVPVVPVVVAIEVVAPLCTHFPALQSSFALQQPVPQGSWFGQERKHSPS